MGFGFDAGERLALQPQFVRSLLGTVFRGLNEIRVETERRIPLPPRCRYRCSPRESTRRIKRGGTTHIYISGHQEMNRHLADFRGRRR